MNRKFLSAFLGLAALVLVSVLARADAYKSDPVHSAVIFKIHHFGAGYVWGTFAGATGMISDNAADPSQTSFDLTVNVDTLDTRSENRDKDLKGPDFFDAKQFPTISFKSTSAKKVSDTEMEVTGDLTLHGQTKSVTVKMENTGTGQGMQKETRTGWETTFTIKRSDYGMTYDAPVIGDEVKITVALEGIKQ